MRYLLILLFTVLTFGVSAQNYTFQATNCRLEILRGATLVSALKLDDTRWTDVSGGTMISVFDGVQTFNAYAADIANYTGTQIDSLKLDLETWRTNCLQRLSGDTLFISNDTAYISTVPLLAPCVLPDDSTFLDNTVTKVNDAPLMDSITAILNADLTVTWLSSVTDYGPWAAVNGSTVAINKGNPKDQQMWGWQIPLADTCGCEITDYTNYINYDSLYQYISGADTFDIQLLSWVVDNEDATYRDSVVWIQDLVGTMPTSGWLEYPANVTNGEWQGFEIVPQASFPSTTRIVDMSEQDTLYFAIFAPGDTLGNAAYADVDAIVTVLTYDCGPQPRNVTYNTVTNTYGTSVNGVCLGVDSLTRPDNTIIRWDLSNPVTEITLTGNATLSTPVDGCDGEAYELIINQDGTGGRTLSYTSAYEFPAGATPTITTAAGSTDVLTCIWRESQGVMHCVIQQDFK